MTNNQPVTKGSRIQGTYHGQAFVGTVFQVDPSWVDRAKRGAIHIYVNLDAPIRMYDEDRSVLMLDSAIFRDGLGTCSNASFSVLSR